LPSTDASKRPSSDRSLADGAVDTGALVVVEADRGVLSVTGPERVSWLNGVVTCDVSIVGPERAGFGLLLSKQGKIQTDFYVLGDSERLLLAVAPGTAAAVQAELDRMLVMEDVELSDRSGELAVLSLHGPRAFELARVEAVNSGGVAGELDRTGSGGAVLLVRRSSVDEVLLRLESAGGVPSKNGDWSRVRVIRGVGLFGVDYGPSDNPHEATLDRRAIAWDKGCYLGQEAVFMQDARGKVKRRLVVLRVGEKVEVAAGLAIERPSGEQVGEVTSGTGAPSGERYALGKVLAPDCEPGTELVVGGAAARVVARAFDAADLPSARNPGQTV
jgi:folate-binding protein YgfZ